MKSSLLRRTELPFIFCLHGGLSPTPLFLCFMYLYCYPVAKRLGMAFHPTFQVLRRSFSTLGKKEAHPTEMQAQLGPNDIRTTLGIYNPDYRPGSGKDGEPSH